FLSAVAPWAPSCSEIADSRVSSKRTVKQVRSETSFSETASTTTTFSESATETPDSEESSCPQAKARAAKARALRASPDAAPSPSPSESGADSEEPLAESGQWVPAVLKTMEKVKDSTTLVRASQRIVKAGKHEGSDWYGRAMELHNDGHYEEAIAAFQKSIDAGFREEAATYNIACGYARLGKRDQAFEWLHKAMDAGFDLQKYLSHDDDLDGLKGDPRWREVKRAVEQHPSSRAEREAAAAVAHYERLVARNPKDGEG